MNEVIAFAIVRLCSVKNLYWLKHIRVLLLFYYETNILPLTLSNQTKFIFNLRTLPYKIIKIVILV